jgi:putative sterol carrier protein
MPLTPQESEQLSKYVSDDGYVKKQKEDIEELASMFKDMLGQEEETNDTAYIAELEACFVPQEEFKANYLFMIDGREKPLTIQVDNQELNCFYGESGNIDVYTKLTPEVMERIIRGEMTFQRAFMTGEMTAKGNFKTLRMLDRVFVPS